MCIVYECVIWYFMRSLLLKTIYIYRYRIVSMLYLDIIKGDEVSFLYVWHFVQNFENVFVKLYFICEHTFALGILGPHIHFPWCIVQRYTLFVHHISRKNIFPHILLYIDVSENLFYSCVFICYVHHFALFLCRLI